MSFRRNGMGKAGFVLSLIGAILCWIPIAGVILLCLGFLFSIIGLIFGLAKRRGIGFSIAGLSISSVTLILLFTLILSYMDKQTFINF